MRFPISFQLVLLFFLFPIFGEAQDSKGVSSIEVDEKSIVLPCPAGIVGLRKNSKDYVIDVLVRTEQKPRGSRIHYEVQNGKIYGNGNRVRWELTDTRPGTYHILATQIVNGQTIGESKSATVFIVYNECPHQCYCPLLSISGLSEEVRKDQVLVLNAVVEGGSTSKLKYKWTLENGKVLTGQGTPILKIRVKKNEQGNKLKANLEIGGLGPECVVCNTKHTVAASIID